MITSYFAGIQVATSSFPNFYIIQYRGNAYYACAYRDRFTGKAEISSLLKSLRTVPQYNENDFDFHHVVERPHLADISFAGATVDDNYPGMPTVMVHKGEHQRYNRILRVGETRELYMRTKQGLPPGVVNSENEVRQLMSGPDKDAAKKEIALRIGILKDIYTGVYENNPVLKIVAGNIFNEHLSRLSQA